MEGYRASKFTGAFLTCLSPLMTAVSSLPELSVPALSLDQPLACRFHHTGLFARSIVHQFPLPAHNIAN